MDRGSFADRGVQYAARIALPSLILSLLEYLIAGCDGEERYLSMLKILSVTLGMGESPEKDCLWLRAWCVNETCQTLLWCRLPCRPGGLGVISDVEASDPPSWSRELLVLMG